MNNRLRSVLIAVQLLGACAALAQRVPPAEESTNPQPSSLALNTTADTSLSPDSGNPAIAVSPSLLDFGTIPVGSTRELPCTVRNVACGILTGAASVAAPFHIVEGSPYNLSNRQTQVITVRFSPKSPGMHMTVIRLTNDGASITVMGSANSRLRKSPTRPDSPPHTSPVPPATPPPRQNLRLLAVVPEPPSSGKFAR